MDIFKRGVETVFIYLLKTAYRYNLDFFWTIFSRIEVQKHSEPSASHRRCSSQVAELVWRLKQKQDIKNRLSAGNNEVCGSFVVELME